MSQGATRVASGAVLVLLAVAVVWFAPAPLFFLVVAEALLLLAFREYVAARAGERLDRARPSQPGLPRRSPARRSRASSAAAPLRRSTSS